MNKKRFKFLRIFLIVLSCFFTLWAYIFLSSGFYILGGSFLLADIGVIIQIKVLKRLEWLDNHKGR
jgi:hypothetical protein